MNSKPTYSELEKRIEALESKLSTSRLFDKIIDSQTLVGIVIVQDNPLRLSYANAYMEKLLGFSTVELMALTPADLRNLVHRDDREAFFNRFPGRVEGEPVPDHFKFSAIRKDGSEIRLLLSSSLITYNESPAGFMLVMDVTEQTEAENALKESEERYGQLSDLLPQVVFETDEAGNLTFSNNAAFEILGYTQNDFDKGLNALDMLVPEDRDRAAENMLMIMGGENIGGTEYTALTKTGRTYPVATYSSPIIKAGKSVGLRGVMVDLTEIKRAQAALRKTSEKYRDLFINAPLGIFQSSPSGSPLMVNPAFASMLGFKRTGDVIRRVETFADLYLEPSRGEKLMRLLVERDELAAHEVCLKRTDGKPVWLSLFVKCHRKESGEVDYIDGFTLDITEWKSAEMAKERLETRLQQSQKLEAIGTLAGGIAHDFNNILGVIVGNTELAACDIPEDNPARESLEEVKQACARAKELVRQILSFSRRSDSRLEPVNIAPVIKESLTLLRASIPTSIDIRSHVPERVDTILGDPVHINQIMINLCTNAADAMARKGGVFEVSLENVILDERAAARFHDIRPGAYVHLTVRDTGHGIRPGVLDRIYDPYFTTKEVGKGTGLGLAVVHGIVTGHGGGIRVSSEPGRGTVFEVVFPVAERESQPEPSRNSNIPGGNEHVLLVDDETSLLRIAKKLIERMGYHVAARANPEDALAYFKANPDRIDLVITDMTMPGMSGKKLAEEMMRVRPDIPIILCTGYSEKMNDTAAAGIKAFLMKPLRFRDLAVVIRDVLDAS